MQSDLELSIVIPAYNEEHRLAATLEKIIAYLKPRDYKFELIVVDDGSVDATSEVIKKYALNCATLRSLRNPKRSGKGFSVRRGVLEAQGKYVFFSDADLSTPIEEIDNLLPFLKNQYSLVFASRALRSSKVIVREAWYRDTMGKIFGFLVRHTFLPGVSDSQCGFKGFRIDTAKNIFSRQKLDGFAFDVEVLFIAKRLNLPMKEVPVHWIDSAKSKVNPITDSCKMLLELSKIYLNKLYGKY